nr:MAG TPA: hypothetical protein [Caudoviricetes sp.]
MFIEDKEDKVFIPQTKHTISANDYNQIKNEIQNSIKLAGMEPEKDVVQFPTAIKKLTEQSGTAEMKKITAEGTKQVGIVTAAGTAQKGAVETVGAEQVSAVEAAGTAQVSKVQKEGSEQVAAAKNWASKTDGPVEEDLYSAKKYAQDAAQSAQNSRGLTIGQLVWSQSSLAKDNPGCLPAWTGEYYPNAAALYPDFYTWVKSHPELCKTKAEYDAAITTYGECPYYVADEVSGSLRLPKLANYIKMANSTEGITQKGAGLPNITCPLYAEGGAENNHLADGGNSAGGKTWSASAFNSIYGAADTVQPAHTTLYPWVCAFNAAVPASTAQAAEFTGALTGKANIDLANTTPAQSFINQSMAWGIPDYSAGVAVTYPYTAPTAGLFTAFCTTGVDYIKIGGVDIGMRFSANNHAAVFVKAGDVVQVEGTGGATCHFFPLKGATNA